MTRLNFILFFALIFSSLGLVNAQHRARKQYIELEQINQNAKQYEQEYGQLQLEQSTWAMHSRVELIASQQLQMQVPDSKRVQVVISPAGVSQKINPAESMATLNPSSSGASDISIKVDEKDISKEGSESQVEQAYRMDTLEKKQNAEQALINKSTAKKNTQSKITTKVLEKSQREVTP